MKRYACTVAVGFVLALTGTATASASGGLPLPGQSGTQKTDFGNQSVGEQTNDADVTQKQGNGNLNIAPAIGLFGDAETTTKQGNGNYAESDVDQKNDVDQSQESTQEQSLEQSGGSSGSCCGGQSQTGEQKVYGGDQSVDKQENDADVTQEQGNGNINISPAVSIFGDAETRTEQGNGNVAKSDADQKNDVDQSQSSTQKQDATQERGGGDCCAPSNGYGKHDGTYDNGCCNGQSQTGEQTTAFGDQSVGKQEDDADVTQKQGNDNVNVSPAIAIFGDAETTTKQGNGNYAESDVDQKNDVDQSQESYQRQSLEQSGGSGKCCAGQSQAGEQKVYGGDQSVEKQRNDADVTQKQGNGNANFSPAVSVLGDAETRTYQGNGNVAKSDVDQENDVDQAQSAKQKQHLTQEGGNCCDKPKKKPDCSYGCHPKEPNGGKPAYDCKSKCEPQRHPERECCDKGQSGKQTTSFGEQSVGKQRNDAGVTQKQGNDNESFAPAIGLGGEKHGSCYSKCGQSRHPGNDGAKTETYQGNGNVAKSYVDQKNDVDQSQASNQHQTLVEKCTGLISR
jgi:hypothetical protein